MKFATPDEFYRHCPNLAVIKGYATKLLKFVEEKEKELSKGEKKSESKKSD